MNHETGAAKGSLAQYVAGYLLSLMFTFDAYLIVSKHLYSSSRTMYTVAALAVIQLIVQLVFFLHLGRGSKARYNMLVFGFMLMVVLILVFGTLWIMHHLNYNMTPQQVNKYLTSQDSL